MLTLLIGRLTKIRTHIVSNDSIIGVSISSNVILKSSGVMFESGYLPAHFCSNKEFIPAAAKQIDSDTTAAYTIGLVGCIECLREPGTYHWTGFEISAEKVHVVCTRMENFRKILWLWMTGLVERSLELRLTLPLFYQN